MTARALILNRSTNSARYTDNLRKPVLQYLLIQLRIMYIKVPWTAVELAKIHKFQLPVAS